MHSTVTRVVVKFMRTRSRDQEQTPFYSSLNYGGTHSDTSLLLKKDSSSFSAIDHEWAEMLDVEDRAWQATPYTLNYEGYVETSLLKKDTSYPVVDQEWAEMLDLEDRAWQ
ncbi:hypothetical protein M422DRAFT_774197 [Sphaerobolus stellatus SS14]|nr:hypothetical protein M422DRAFT_774197 [Sphaerobolus stellatus SS14]